MHLRSWHVLFQCFNCFLCNLMAVSAVVYKPRGEKLLRARIIGNLLGFSFFSLFSYGKPVLRSLRIIEVAINNTSLSALIICSAKNPRVELFRFIISRFNLLRGTKDRKLMELGWLQKRLLCEKNLQPYCIWPLIL